jgi:hypothetical protein
MSRLEVPVRDRTLYATGDILLRVELDLDIKTSSGTWMPETVLVDSGTEITTFPAWLAKQQGFPLPPNPTRHAVHAQTGLEIRSGVLRFQIVGLGPTEFQVTCLFLGDPQARPSVNAPAGAAPRKLLQPLHLLDVLRFELKKDPAAGLAHGMMVVETV